MATRRFCDLCDAPARDKVRVETRRKTKSMGTIAVRVHIGLENHPTGFGGPPDLCDDCVKKLLKELKVANG